MPAQVSLYKRERQREDTHTEEAAVRPQRQRSERGGQKPRTASGHHMARGKKHTLPCTSGGNAALPTP